MDHVHSYQEVGDVSATFLFRFCSDVCQHITDSQKPNITHSVISGIIPDLTHLVFMVIAESFGDFETVRKIQNHIDNKHQSDTKKV